MKFKNTKMGKKQIFICEICMALFTKKIIVFLCIRPLEKKIVKKRYILEYFCVIHLWFNHSNLRIHFKNIDLICSLIMEKVKKYFIRNGYSKFYRLPKIFNLI